MFGRQRTMITREGAYFALVVLFILGGAALRQVNLLVTFAGLLVAPAVFHWRLVAITLRRLRMKRTFKPIVHAGETTTVRVELTNEASYLTTWAVSIEDSVIAVSDATVGKAYSFAPRIPARGVATAEYQVTLPHRGQFAFGPMQLSTRFPLGLFCSWLRFYHSDEILALPRLGELKQGWYELFESKRMGREFYSGRRSGNDGDFFALREWRTGDSRRWIHWRSTARLNFPVVRQLEQPQRREAGLIIDLWAPSDPSEEDRGWTEYSISFAATVIESLVASEGRHVHVVVCSHEDRHWSGDISSRAVQSMLQALAVAEPAESTDVALRVAELNAAMRSQAKLVVLSTRDVRHFDLDPSLERRTHWINVRDPETADLFELPPLDATLLPPNAAETTANENAASSEVENPSGESSPSAALASAGEGGHG